MRPTEARIDLEALRSNFRLAKFLAPSSRVLAVVKANAYGHGVQPCVEALESMDTPPDAWGVAMIEEALEIRRVGSTLPIVLFEGFFERSAIPELAEHQLDSVIASPEQLALFLESPPTTPIRVWLKLDTGMHRLGFSTAGFVTAYEALVSSPAVSEVILMTHFANADRTESPDTELQTERFDRVIAGRSAPQSLANSAALLCRTDTHRDWVRPGIMLYGLDPLDSPVPKSNHLRPVLSLVSRVSAVRDLPAGESIGYGSRYVTEQRTRVGVVPIGYADGYPREAPDGTPVLVDGFEARIIGQPSMDRITVDLTKVPKAAVGSPVELWGTNLPANQVARACGTIAYTLVTGISPRVPRVYDHP